MPDSRRPDDHTAPGDERPSKTPTPWTYKSGPSGEAVTIGVALLGGLGFFYAGVPGGAISGSVLSVALMSYFGAATPIGNVMRLVAMAITGVSIGSAIEPAMLRNVAAYPVSIGIMTVCVICVTLASMAVSVLISRWSKPTALLAAVPGSMAYILSVALSMKADLPRVAVVQMSRVIFLVVFLPIVIVMESGAHLAPLGGKVTDPPLVLALTTLAAVALGLVFVRLRMGGGMLFGAMIASGIIHATGLAPGRVPMPIMLVGQIMIGAWAGSRFAGFDWNLFGRTILSSSLAIGASMIVSFVFAAFAANLLGMPFGATLIAYAPGGLEAMMVLALGLGIDPLFVSAHHFSRYFLINFTLPLIIGWLMRRENAKAPGIE